MGHNGGLIRATAGRLLPGGEAVVRHGEESVLVANAVPGDLLDIRLETRRRGVWRGHIEKIVDASPQRVPAPCPVADRCGGCALQFVAPAGQAGIKSDWVLHAFRDLMREESEWLPATVDDSARRRRLRWMVGQDEQGCFLGFFAPASHRPVRHGQCMVLSDSLQELHAMLSDSLPLDHLQSIQAVELADGMHVVLEGELAPSVPDDCPEAGGLPLQWWWRHEGITRPLSRPVQAFHDLLPAGPENIALAIGPDDFVQAVAAGNRAMIAQIQAWSGKAQRIADLFCGIGNLSLPLAKATGAALFGAELNAASVRAAKANAKQLDVAAEFFQANLFEDFDMEPFIGADLLIIDPPRRGARRICSRINHLLPARIIMISCDPAAGARDGELLAGHGYRLAALRALDLFPCAGHVEAMSLWLRE